jgi:hypothetical protein
MRSLPRIPLTPSRRGLLPSRRGLLVIFGLTCLVSAAALATAKIAFTGTSPPPDLGPVQFSPGRGPIPRISGDPAAAVEAVAKNFPRVRNPRVAPSSVADVAGLSLDYDLSVRDFNGAEIAQAAWEGDLFAGVIADEYLASSLGKIADSGGTLVSSDGERRPFGGGVGRVVPDQAFAQIPPGFAAGIRQRAGDVKLAGLTTSRLHGIQDAVVINATASDVASVASAFMHEALLEKLLGTPLSTYEGVLFVLRDARTNEPVFVQGTAPRAGASLVWVSPALGIKFARGFEP